MYDGPSNGSGTAKPSSELNASWGEFPGFWIVTHSENAVGSTSQSIARRYRRSVKATVPVFVMVTTSS